MSHSDNGMYGQGRGYNMSNPVHHNNNWNQNRGNLDMPNLQSLGINPQGQNGPPNQGMNMNPLPINPAVVAAALNQWGLFGNVNQNQDQVSDPITL